MSNKERPSIFIGWVHKGKKNLYIKNRLINPRPKLAGDVLSLF